MLPPDLIRRLQEVESKLPSMTVTLVAHKGKPIEEAFGELVVVLAREVINLNEYVSRIAGQCASHPLQQGPLHHYDGGTVVIVEKKK